MRRIICLLLIAAVLLTGCSGATGNNTDNNQEIETDSTQEDETMESEKLLTVEELIEATGIDPNDYEDGFLQNFIEHYNFTANDIEDWNIAYILERYLEHYDDPDPIDVSDIFNPDRPRRESNFTEDVVAIAFETEDVAAWECVYYDLENGLRYRANGYFFEDLNAVEPTEFPDGQALIERLNSLGTFSWEDVPSPEDVEFIEDGGYTALAILYTDGSAFTVTVGRAGNYGLLPSYSEVRSLLLD